MRVGQVLGSEVGTIHLDTAQLQDAEVRLEVRHAVQVSNNFLVDQRKSNFQR